MFDTGSWRGMLLARPVPNFVARVENAGRDGLRIAVATVKPWYFVPPVSWIVPLSKERTVVLDSVGAYIWRLCDGERTVENIVDEFAAKHRLTFHEARAAVTGYMKLLVQRSVLAIALTD